MNDPVVDLRWLKEKQTEIFNEVIECNEYQIYRDNIQDKNVIDIGANVGMFSIFAAYLGAKRIVAVEPAEKTYAILRENVNLSTFNNIETYKNLVLSVKDAYVKLPLQQNSGHNSLYKTSETYETVKTVTLKDLLAKFPNNEDIVLKIDCEGSEYDILLNLDTEDLINVKTLHIEIHADMHHVYKGFEVIENKISSFGFTKIRENTMHSYTANSLGDITSISVMPIKLCCFQK